MTAAEPTREQIAALLERYWKGSNRMWHVDFLGRVWVAGLLADADNLADLVQQAFIDATEGEEETDVHASV